MAIARPDPPPNRVGPFNWIWKKWFSRLYTWLTEQIDTLNKAIPTSPGLSANIGYNCIINGGMDVWQRNNTFTSPSNSWTADRWHYQESSAGALTVSQNPDVPTGLERYSLRLSVTSPDLSITATDYAQLEYRMEMYDILQMGFGTSNPQTLTLSFWVKSSLIGTYCLCFQNNANNRSYVVEYTISSTNWEQKAITITADTTGTWTTATPWTTGLRIFWILMAGSDIQTATTDSWIAPVDLRATANQVNWYGSISNTFNLKNVKLEIGDTATEFVPRLFEEELALCQRYYEHSYTNGQYPGATVATQISYHVVKASGAGPAVSATLYGWNPPFNVRKVVSPTMTFYSPNSGTAARVYDNTGATDLTVLNTTGIGQVHVPTIILNAAPTVDHVLSMHWQADAELS